MMDNVALWTLIAGGFVLLMIVLFSALAFRNRRSQLLSLMLARPFLMLAGSLEVIARGMLVWLSFWGTAFFTQTYYPKLVIIVGLMVLGVSITSSKASSKSFRLRRISKAKW
jgi:uncharacterized integral membrane protein